MMCKTCFDNEASHEAAAVARLKGANGKRARKAVEWEM